MRRDEIAERVRSLFRGEFRESLCRWTLDVERWTLDVPPFRQRKGGSFPLTRRESVSRYYRFQPVVIALARMVL
jgi:hypothetical protein